MSAYEELTAIFSGGISAEYLGEDVKLVEHMLQCGDLAIENGASDAMVVAALLHDIGHLLIESSVADYENAVDAHHDEVGAAWVAARFPLSVSEPVRLHVAAKQYLVATEPEYLARLSAASQKTLQMQGGVFSEAEANEFIQQPYARDGVTLRIWDDEGKIRNKPTRSLAEFKSYVEAVAIS